MKMGTESKKKLEIYRILKATAIKPVDTTSFEGHAPKHRQRESR